MYDLNHFIQKYRQYEEGKLVADNVDFLKQLVDDRHEILEKAMSNSFSHLAGILAVREVLYHRNMGTYENILRPSNFLYLGLTQASEIQKEHDEMHFESFCRSTNAVVHLDSDEFFDKLLPLRSMKDVDYAMETLSVLAQIMYSDLNPPGPATPDPVN